MAIVPDLPVTLTNGTTADASQVMTNLNAIVTAVNNGAMPLAPDGFTSSGNVVVNANLSVDGTTALTGQMSITNDVANSISLTITDTAANGANLQLTGDGETTPTKTLRVTGGMFQITNSAYSNTPMSMDDAGDVTFTGNVTAYSDERLKKDWAVLPADFVERLAAVKSGTYSRTDIDRQQVGVSAQSLQALMPEAIEETHDGYLAVAYGQAALAACVELAKEVMRLRALLEPVK